jgi:hypothetical protein
MVDIMCFKISENIRNIFDKNMAINDQYISIAKGRQSWVV